MHYLIGEFIGKQDEDILGVRYNRFLLDRLDCVKKLYPYGVYIIQDKQNYYVGHTCKGIKRMYKHRELKTGVVHYFSFQELGLNISEDVLKSIEKQVYALIKLSSKQTDSHITLTNKEEPVEAKILTQSSEEAIKTIMEVMRSILISEFGIFAPNSLTLEPLVLEDEQLLDLGDYVWVIRYNNNNYHLKKGDLLLSKTGRNSHYKGEEFSTHYLPYIRKKLERAINP